MSANPSVTIFNANTLPVQVSVNNGASFTIAGASAATNWVPQTPSSGSPTWSNNQPGQNVIAPGTNYLNITPQGTLQPYTTTMILPGTIQWNSLQLYIYFNSNTEVSWIVLNEGQYVTGNIQLTSMAE